MCYTQGCTVALFYCFMNTEVRHAIRYHVERWKTGRAIGGGRRRGTSYSKDWSPRSRTESIRYVCHPKLKMQNLLSTLFLIGARQELIALFFIVLMQLSYGNTKFNEVRFNYYYVTVRGMASWILVQFRK